MNDERERDAPAGDLGDPRPETGDGEADTVVTGRDLEDVHLPVVQDPHDDPRFDLEACAARVQEGR